MNIESLFGSTSPVPEEKNPGLPSPAARPAEKVSIDVLFSESKSSDSVSSSNRSISQLFMQGDNSPHFTTIAVKEGHSKEDKQLWNRVRDRVFRNYTKDIPPLKQQGTADYVEQVQQLSENHSFSPTPETMSNTSADSLAQQKIKQFLWETKKTLELGLTFSSSQPRPEEIALLRKKFRFLPEKPHLMLVQDEGRTHQFVFWETGHFAPQQKVGIFEVPTESKESKETKESKMSLYKKRSPS